MILVDTSVWVDHFRRGCKDLARALEDDAVLTHPFVIGELACGNLRRRGEILELMRALPHAPFAGDHDVMTLIDERRLMGRGLGWVDVHLLASAILAGARLWSLDRKLRDAARTLTK